MEDAGEPIEQLLRIEADAAVQEVEFAVKRVEISKTLPQTKERVYMNLTTKEKQSFCVEFSVQGFRVVGKTFDKLEMQHETQYFETIYALLDNLSPGYRRSFGDALAKKLARLQEQQASELQENKN